MRSRPLFFAHSPVFAVTVFAFLATPAVAEENHAVRQMSGRSCITAEPNAGEAAFIQHQLELASQNQTQSQVRGLIQVAFHVIHDGVEGNVTDAQIQAQIAELNLDFSGADGAYDTGYRFVLTSVDRTLNPDWFNMAMGSNQEKRAKEALNVDPLHHLNVYTIKMESLGWSTFPWGVAEDDPHQGIVIDYGSLPGGNIVNFNLGRTATHEVGHYLGLFHTFFTGCTVPNDYVDDTTAQAAQTTGCPPDGLDTCALPGVDPIHNYLDYSYDACYAEFTPGQDARMDQMVTTYRPNLLITPLAVDAGARPVVSLLRPAAPNPASGRVRLVFDLPREERVRLRIHDLAGRVVATLVDGVLPAGAHTRFFEPGSGSGVYFADLDADGRRASQRLVLTR